MHDTASKRQPRRLQACRRYPATERPYVTRLRMTSLDTQPNLLGYRELELSRKRSPWGVKSATRDCLKNVVFKYLNRWQSRELVTACTARARWRWRWRSMTARLPGDSCPVKILAPQRTQHHQLETGGSTVELSTVLLLFGSHMRNKTNRSSFAHRLDVLTLSPAPAAKTVETSFSSSFTAAVLS